MSKTETKTYTIAGTTNKDGARTFRFANGKLNVRRNMLKFDGHTAIKLFELPRPMTKVQAMAYLQVEMGTKAKFPTRAKNKRAKSPIQAAAEALAAKNVKRRAAKAAATGVAA